MAKVTRMVCATFTAALLVGGPTGSAWGRTAHADSRVKVKIINFAFQPRTVTIPVGTRVKWVNRAANMSHTATSDTGVWDSGVLMPDQTFIFKFRRTGTFNYHCSIHPTMTGSIDVTP